MTSGAASNINSICAPPHHHEVYKSVGRLHIIADNTWCIYSGQHALDLSMLKCGLHCLHRSLSRLQPSFRAMTTSQQINLCLHFLNPKVSKDEVDDSAVPIVQHLHGTGYLHKKCLVVEILRSLCTWGLIRTVYFSLLRDPSCFASNIRKRMLSGILSSPSS